MHCWQYIYICAVVFGAFFSSSAIIRLFVHPLSWLSCWTRAAGGLGRRLWEFAFSLFLCIQWTLLVSKIVVCSYYGFLIFRQILHPFGSFSFSGLCRRTSFLVKTIGENLLCCFRFSPLVLSSSALAKNCSELNGCTKTLTFEEPLCSGMSPESPLDARK